jgi:hypothetical protein
MVKENLFMYSSCLHIFYVLFQCHVDIMSLNHYHLYDVEAINYQYVLFHINVQCTFLLFIFKYRNLHNNLSGKIIIIIFIPFIMISYYS